MRRGRSRRASSGGSQTRYLDRDDRRPRRGRWPGPRRRRRRARRVSIGLVGNAAEVLPELLARAACAPTSSPTRPRAHDPLGGYVPAGLSSARRPLRCASATPRSYVAPLLRRRWPHHVRAMLGFGQRARSSSTTATTCAARRGGRRASTRPAFRLPGLRAGLHPAALLRGQGPVPLGGALGRSRRHRRDRPRALAELFPDDDRLHRWLAHGRGAGRLPGAAGADLLARLRRARRAPGCGSTRWWRRARCRRRS